MHWNNRWSSEYTFIILAGDHPVHIRATTSVVSHDPHRDRGGNKAGRIKGDRIQMDNKTARKRIKEDRIQMGVWGCRVWEQNRMRKNQNGQQNSSRTEGECMARRSMRRGDLRNRSNVEWIRFALRAKGRSADADVLGVNAAIIIEDAASCSRTASVRRGSLEATNVPIATTNGVRDIPSYAVEGGMARRCTVSNARDAMTDDTTGRFNGENWRRWSVRSAGRSHATRTHRVGINHINRRCANGAGTRLFPAAAAIE